MKNIKRKKVKTVERAHYVAFLDNEIRVYCWEKGYWRYNTYKFAYEKKTKKLPRKLN